MQKCVVNVSLPPNHPDREKMVDMTPEEEAAIQAFWAANAAKPVVKSLEDQVAEISLKVQTLEAVKEEAVLQKI